MGRADALLRGVGRGYSAFFFAVERPLNLAIGRIVLFAFALGYFSFMRPVDFTALCEVPSLFLQPPGLTRFLGFGVASKSTVALMQALWVAASVAACCGLFTRFSMVVATVLFGYLVSLTNAYGHPRIGHPLLFFSMAIMCLTQCAQVLSLDRLLFRGRLPLQPQYVWPRRLIFLMPILVFFGAGIEKVRTSGLLWGWSDTLEITVRTGRYEFALNDFQAAAGQFAVEHLPLRIAGVAALALELSAPLALVNGRLRAVMIAAFGGFIISIWFLIAEPMFEFLVLLLFGVDWDALWRRARERAARYSPVSLRSMR